MLINLDIILHQFESMPEWLGLEDRLKYYLKEKQDLERIMNRMQEPGKGLVLKYQRILDDIEFFKSLMNFLHNHFKFMQDLFDTIKANHKVHNEIAEINELNNDLKIAYNYERDENALLLEIVGNLCQDKKYPFEKIDSFFDGLRKNSTRYQNYLNQKFNEQI